MLLHSLTPRRGQAWRRVLEHLVDVNVFGNTVWNTLPIFVTRSNEMSVLEIN